MASSTFCFVNQISFYIPEVEDKIDEQNGILGVEGFGRDPNN